MERQDLKALQLMVAQHTQKRVRESNKMEMFNQECLFQDVEGIINSLSEVILRRMSELDKVEYRTRVEKRYCQ